MSSRKRVWNEKKFKRYLKEGRGKHLAKMPMTKGYLEINTETVEDF